MAEGIDWTAANVFVQAIAGTVGAHAGAIASHEHRFGLLGHSLAGLIAGATSGWFLQTIVVTVVTAGGALNSVSAVDNAMIQALTGLVVGAIAMLAVGFAKRMVDERSGQIGRAS